MASPELKVELAVSHEASMRTRPRLRSRMLLLPVGLLWLVLPFITSDYYLGIAILVIYYGYLATCWNIAGGYAGQASLGHSLFIGTGAYTCALLFRDYGITPWVSMWVGAAIAMVLGLFVGYLCFRSSLRGLFFAIVTLAFAQIFVYIVISVPALGGSNGISLPISNDRLGAMQFGAKAPYYVLISVMLWLVLGWLYVVRRGRLMYYLQAIRENEAAARASGIPVIRYQMIAVAISAGLSALGGSFYLQYAGFIDPATVLGVDLSLIILIYAFFGGAGTLLGPLIGAAVLELLNQGLNAFLGQGNYPGLNLVVYGIILTLVVMFFPNGIVGTLQRRWSEQRS
jgi:branched-chain amino acid transport system permease protein